MSNLNNLSKKNYYHWLLLFLWIILGFILRVNNLELKPPWSDEWATLVFSLGNSFRSIPLNQVISLDALLNPLRLDAAKTAHDAVHYLLAESTHPPLYFILNHWWLDLIGSDGTLVSIWGGRFLSCLLGVATIPAMFGLGYLYFRSWFVAQLAAALMAVSPFAIYLSQEARHYNLAILWLIASFSCLIMAVRSIHHQQKVSLAIPFAWIFVNVCGVATHYFFALALVAQTIVLIYYFWDDAIAKKNNYLSNYWQRIYLALVGTLIGCLPWLFIWRDIPDNQLTSWIYQEQTWLNFYKPIARICLWLTTKIILLPVEGVSDTIAITSGIILLIFLGFFIPRLWQGNKILKQNQAQRLSIKVLELLLSSAIALILVIAVFVGADLSLSARFQFFYLPIWLLWIAANLSAIKQKNQSWILALIILGICGSLAINHNLAFQKVERPDLVVPVIVEAHQDMPVVLAINHYTHGQTGELLSLAWQFNKLIKNKEINWQPLFLLDNHQAKKKSRSVSKSLVSLERPFQLWLINYTDDDEPKIKNCIANPNFIRRDTGYKYRLNQCN